MSTRHRKQPRPGHPGVDPQLRRVVQTFTLPAKLRDRLRRLRGDDRAAVNAAVERVVEAEASRIEAAAARNGHASRPARHR